MEIQAREMLKKHKEGKLTQEDIKNDPMGVLLMLPFLDSSTKFTDQEIDDAFEIMVVKRTQVIEAYNKGPQSFVRWLQVGTKDLDSAVGIAYLVMVALEMLRNNPIEVIKQQMQGDRK